MAGIDNIIDTILSDAKTDAQQALAEAQHTAQRLRGEAEEEMAQQRTQAMKKAKEECLEIAKRAQVGSRLEMRKADLAYRQARIETVFAQVRSRLDGLPRQEYDDLMFRLAVENAQGGEVLIPCSQGTPISAELVERINEHLEQAGQRPLSLSGQQRPIHGGFILAHDGMEINCSLDAILRYYRDKLQGEVAAMLFAKED